MSSQHVRLRRDRPPLAPRWLPHRRMERVLVTPIASVAARAGRALLAAALVLALAAVTLVGADQGRASAATPAAWEVDTFGDWCATGPTGSTLIENSSKAFGGDLELTGVAGTPDLFTMTIEATFFGQEDQNASISFTVVRQSAEDGCENEYETLGFPDECPIFSVTFTDSVVPDVVWTDLVFDGLVWGHNLRLNFPTGEVVSSATTIEVEVDTCYPVDDDEDGDVLTGSVTMTLTGTPGFGEDLLVEAKVPGTMVGEDFDLWFCPDQTLLPVAEGDDNGDCVGPFIQTRTGDSTTFVLTLDMLEAQAEDLGIEDVAGAVCGLSFIVHDFPEGGYSNWVGPWSCTNAQTSSTSSGMQAINVGVTVGGPVPASVPAGEGGLPRGGGLLAMSLALGAAALLSARLGRREATGPTIG